MITSSASSAMRFPWGRASLAHEIEVLRLIATRNAHKEIDARLPIGEDTVKRHVTNIKSGKLWQARALLWADALANLIVIQSLRKPR
jgi:hypothetical protein